MNPVNKSGPPPHSLVAAERRNLPSVYTVEDSLGLHLPTERCPCYEYKDKRTLQGKKRKLCIHGMNYRVPRISLVRF